MWSPRAKVEREIPAEVSPVLAAALATEYFSQLSQWNVCHTLDGDTAQVAWDILRSSGCVILGDTYARPLRWLGTTILDHLSSFFSSITSCYQPWSIPKQGYGIGDSRGSECRVIQAERPRIDHVVHLLHDLKRNFKTAFLASVEEDEAVNKQVWSLYHHSYQTFLSLTAQRALKSTSRSVLFPNAEPLSPTSEIRSPPPSPSSTKHVRNVSFSSEPIDPGPIEFGSMTEDKRRRTWRALEGSLFQ